MKRLVSIILMFAVVFCVGTSLVGCKNETQIETYGDFIYSVEYYDANGKRVIKGEGVSSGIMIRGLSEAGKGKSIVVVPEYINSRKVVQLGYEKFWSREGVWKSDNLNKIYLTHSVIITKSIFENCNNLEKIIFLAHDKDEYIKRGEKSVFLTSYYYSNEEYTTKFFKYNDGCWYYFSNVSFRYNYENEPNDGYYWIDDYSYGDKIEYVPEPPTRAGYIFAGWYKEFECINEWDFETDTLPQAQYTEDNEEIYQETKLYAKWIKN